MTSVDPYLGRERTPSYDCLAFAADVWRDLTGEDLRQRLDGLFTLADERELAPHHLRAFERLASPADPCIVLMRRPRVRPHLGVYVRGSVLHLRETAQYVPIAVASSGFSRVEFFR